MARAGPKKTQRYGVAFKRTAVQLSQRPGVQVQAVAEALDVHPFMLARWRKEAREGRLRGAVTLPAAVTASMRTRDMKRFQVLRRAHRLLQEEHALLNGSASRGCAGCSA